MSVERSSNKSVGKRIYIKPLGDVYQEILRFRAYLNKNSVSSQAKIDLSAYLQLNKEETDKMLRVLADSRGITLKELKVEILKNDLNEK